MVKKNWRTRVRGSPRQRGVKFQLDTTSAQGKRLKLPKVKGKVHTAYPTGKVVQYSIEDMPIEQLSTKASVIQDPNPENFEARVQHFTKMYNEGETIPPILFHRLEDGRIQILDGRARLEAFRRMGIPRIPAVENGILSSIKSGLTQAFKGTKGFAEGLKTDKGKWTTKPESVAQAVGRRVGSDIRKHAQTARGIAGKAIEHGKAVYNFLEGTGTVVKGQDGGGDLVIPSKEFVQTTLNGTPKGDRPCVIEKKVKGKVLRTYGTLLDPRTNPRYLQKYGYTDVE